MYIHMYIYIHTCTYAYIDIYIYSYTYIHTHVFVYMYVYIDTETYIYMHLELWVASPYSTQIWSPIYHCAEYVGCFFLLGVWGYFSRNHHGFKYWPQRHRSASKYLNLVKNAMDRITSRLSISGCWTIILGTLGILDHYFELLDIGPFFCAL